MQEGDSILLSDNQTRALVTKKISEQSFVIECLGPKYFFTRLIDIADMKNALTLGTWAGVFKRD